MYNKNDPLIQVAVKKLVESIGSKPDVISVDVPLFIRLLEFAKEDAKDDMQLHKITENMLNLSKSGAYLTMNDYNKIIGK